MSKRKIFGAAAGLVLLLFPSLAHAQCIEDPREVRFDQDNVVRLKSYLCRAGQDQNDPQIKVEFHRLSNVAASILIGKAPPPKALRTAIGAPKLVENETFKAYAYLLKEFGETLADSRSLYLALKTQGSDDTAGSSDDSGRKIRTIIGELSGKPDFPNPEEIQSLQAKQIPPGMHFYYSVSKCLDDPDKQPAGDFTCHQYDLGEFDTTFWRPMTAADADNFRANLEAYNRLLDGGKNRKKNGNGLMQTATSEKYLKFARYVAGDSWPDGFLTLSGSFISGGCGDDDDPNAVPEGLYGWKFGFAPHTITIDAISITNSSRKTIALQGLFGEEASLSGVRAASLDAGLPSSSGALSFPAETLAPGQSVLIPSRILFMAPEWTRVENQTEAGEIYARVGANGFGGNVGGFGIPALKSFAYGPEIAVSGVLIEGKRIDLAARSDNQVDLTIAAGAGSCPYLLSWDGEDRDWVNHGKVLHQGEGKWREYSETKKFEGFRARFRIEEREPEIAHIDHAELVAALKNGETLALKPNNKKLTARDDDYVELMWGEGIELVFSLPEGVAEEDVVETRLTLTGYYERYSSLMARSENGAKPRRGAATDFSPVSGQTRLCVTQALLRSMPTAVIQAGGNL